MEDKNIKVVLVEDEEFWQKNICKYIEKETNDIKVVEVATCKEEMLEVIDREIDIDVVLMDINLTGANLDGIEIIEILSRRGIKTIALTSISDDDVIINSFESGAINYITKSSIFDIISSIYDAAQGKSKIHYDASGALLSKMQEEKKMRLLTSSEQEVYRLQKKGYSRTKIAEQLFKSVNTVKKQIQSIRKKLNIQ
ncbi:response regulator transcription factor [Priestia endophytica]|uniref:response regulator transcription factor n=1 Tax=Priestia endophytica TaxID=135735 RepID=UPI00124D8574|nr:response regulator transcription factor [Priestia endophytica]KAB2488194.1 response regulator transcription factor [Priestia endophytica]